MAITILNGYIIKLIEYQVFDQILTIMSDEGNKISLISLGSRKINSKNARHLVVGNFNENEFFPARSKNKIGRLKKTVTIKPIDWKVHDYLSFNVLNDYIYFHDGEEIKNFLLYEKILDFILNKKYSDTTILVVLLAHIIIMNGLALNNLKCFNCNASQDLSLSLFYSKWICESCKNNFNNLDLIEDKVIIKAIQNLISQKVIINKFTKNQTIAIIGILQFIIYKEMGIKFNCLKI